MYFVRKTFEFSAAHRLRLDYPSQCTNLHGHNWKVTVECRARELNANGMVVDFTDKYATGIQVIIVNEGDDTIAGTNDELQLVDADGKPIVTTVN